MRNLGNANTDNLLAVIQGDRHKGMDALPFQVLMLKRLRFPDIFQAFNDDVLADTELLIPAGAYLRGRFEGSPFMCQSSILIGFWTSLPRQNQKIGVIIPCTAQSRQYIAENLPFEIKCRRGIAPTVSLKNTQ